MQCCFPFLQSHDWDIHTTDMGSNHHFWKHTTLSSIGNLLGKRLFVAGKEKAKKGATGSVTDSFLALLKVVWSLCCFFSLHSIKHTPWRKQDLLSQLKVLCYSSYLITNYVTSTHLNPHAEGLQTIRESDETTKSQFTLNISQIATNHRHSVLSQI